VQQGEERLIAGVERGVFPISFAVLVAKTRNEDIQNLLMDAFDKDLITTENFAVARRLIATRTNDGQTLDLNGKKYDVQQLKKDITVATKQKNSFVREAKNRENRVLTLMTALDTLWLDEAFVRLVDSEDLAKRPHLTGDSVDAPIDATTKQREQND